jgi:DNA replication protein DnaC
MAYEKGVISAVLSLFDKRKEKKKIEKEERRNKVYAAVPKIIDIENELRKISLDAVRSALNSGENAEKAMRSFKKKSLELQAQRAELLVINGFAMDYLDDVYSCKKCKDNGYIGSVMCECFKKELKKEAYHRSNLGAMLTEQTFKGFDYSYYSEEKNTKYGVSPRENIEKTFNFCKKYADKFSPDSNNLLFVGKTGLGKTYLSTAIAKTVIDKGYGVIYDTAQNILSKLERVRFGRENDEGITNQYMDCDLLIIDDLGAEFKTSFTEAAIFNLINTRLISKKPMIISTNNYEDLNELYSERIVSRLTCDFVTLFLFGEDIRLKKLAEKRK